ncbi:MAG: helix-turn-helix transcriptional regulator [Lachnospiraceae bacterium]|nr:helix-turn-helix transcriptional regulator [Lachnospiraceae bacterium]
MNAEYSATITENIRMYRNLRGLTQENMAEKLMIDSQYYAQLEQGRRNFTIERIIDACRILGVKIEDIVHFEEPRENTAPLIESINRKIAGASPKQLMLIEKFIDEFVDFV